MLFRKKHWLWIGGLVIMGIILIFNISRSHHTPQKEVTDICLDLYEKAAEEKRVDDLEMIRIIINRLGENGYPAVDSKNQINMTHAEQVEGFCEMVDAKKEAEITIIQVDYLGGFVKYDLQTGEGDVEVTRSYYEYKDGEIQRTDTGCYLAENWNYTKEGYLMFSGSWFSEDLYVLSMSDARDYAALRIRPLAETYRELNRKYLQPIGYERNNMFLVDWSEEDFGDLDFYDMYDIFSPKVDGTEISYADDLKSDDVYRIPRVDFERAIMAFFDIDSETLQSKTIYHSEDETYEYRPRGFYEVEYPEYPYSEVVGFTENRDGTMTLTVNVVFPYTGNSKVYSHEVVVRSLQDGGVQYVSNRVIPSEGNCEETWYTPRLTAAKSDTEESVYWYVPQSSDCLISDEEKEQLKSTVLSVAKSVSPVYKDLVIEDAPDYSSGISELPDEQRKAVVEQIGQGGLVCVGEDTNMQNPEGIERFYSEYLNGQDLMMTVYEVEQDGLIGAVTFIYRDGKLQTYYIGVRWGKDGMPEIQGTSVRDVNEIKLTEKGYFIYTYEDVIAHGNLRKYWRTKPLSEECRELTKKYISGLSYVNYDMLVINWDSSNVEDILMPCMYEDIYRIYSGENLKPEDGKIPAEEYERVMTTYFPVSAEQLREHCGYDESSNSYKYERIYARQYPPFGEVVDYTKNVDGTITLIVDGVWPDHNSDFAFRNEIVVLPFEDGTFRYLSNNVEQKELELPQTARPKG